MEHIRGGGAFLQDQQFVERIKVGDNAAFTQLVETHQKRVYSVAYGIVRNPDDAMDAAQETFLRAWSKIGSWRGEAALSTWLCRIASNIALDITRKRKRAVPVEEVEFDPDCAQPCAEAVIIQTEEKSQLAMAIAALPEKYRQLIILRHTGEMSYQEMADLLGLSLTQVKNRLLRARQLLKQSLKGRLD